MSSLTFFYHSGQEFKETEPSSKESVLKRCEGTQGHLIQETQSTVLQTVTQRRSKKKENSANTRGGIGGK